MNKGLTLAILLIVLAVAGFMGYKQWKRLNPDIPRPTGNGPMMMPGGMPGPAPAAPAPAPAQ